MSEKVTKEELARRILALPEDQQQDAIEYIAQISAVRKGEEITLFAGTEDELIVPRHSLPTLDEWQKGSEARLADPSIEGSGDMPSWEARVSPRIIEAWKRQVAKRQRQAEETLALFEDDES